jgi:hypothetical protein
LWFETVFHAVTARFLDIDVGSFKDNLARRKTLDSDHWE